MNNRNFNRKLNRKLKWKPKQFQNQQMGSQLAAFMLTLSLAGSLAGCARPNSDLSASAFSDTAPSTETAAVISSSDDAGSESSSKSAADTSQQASNQSSSSSDSNQTASKSSSTTATTQTKSDTLMEDLLAIDQKQVEAILDQMSLEEKCAQMFIVEPEALLPDASAAPNENGEVTVTDYSQIAAMQQSIPVGGIILFGRNLQSADQVQNLLAQTNQASINQLGLPALLGIDEEGGSVARIARSGILGQIDEPGAQEIADTGDANQAYQEGSKIGRHLHDLGFNLDFAPVMDVLTNPNNPVMQDRTYGNDPQKAAQFALAFGQGLLDQDVLPVYKHFPGHGDTAEDSHEGYTYSNKTLDELLFCELIPFQEAVDEKMPLIMASHIALPNVTNSQLPATLSPDILTGILRYRMGFQGLIVTDSMEMKAITSRYSSTDAIGGAISAGTDLILMPENFQSNYWTLVDKVKSGQISEDRIDESVRRIIRVKLALAKSQNQLSTEFDQ